MNGAFVKPKKKWGKALWSQVDAPGFKQQHRALRPENGPAGGVKARSGSEAARMGVYNPIAAMFKRAHPYCEAHDRINPGRSGEVYRVPTEHVHHKRGRSGLLLFDVRYFVAVCAACHTAIDADRERARELGLLAAEGDWRKQ